MEHNSCVLVTNNIAIFDFKFQMDSLLTLGSLLLLGSSLVASQECGCTYSASLVYDGTYKWDCSYMTLIDIPSVCFGIVSWKLNDLNRMSLQIMRN